MPSKKVIQNIKNSVVLIGTPFSNGSGFYLEKENIIVTNEHVVRGNQQVVVSSEIQPKAICDIIFLDEVHDIAFLSPPKENKLSSLIIANEDKLKEGELVIAMGHPLGNTVTSTQGIISNMKFDKSGIKYIQHDAALNAGNSGGPLVNSNHELVGINTYVNTNGHNLGFSLPVQYLREILAEIPNGHEKSVRCSSCQNIILDTLIDKGYCPQCGAKLATIRSIKKYTPTGITFTIEQVIKALNFDPILSRCGLNFWKVEQGSAQIQITYHEKNGLIVGDAFLCRLPKQNIKELYRFILRQNYDLKGLSISVRGTDVILSLLIFDQYLNQNTATTLFKNLFHYADYFDDILMEKFGALASQSYTKVD